MIGRPTNVVTRVTWLSSLPVENISPRIDLTENGNLIESPKGIRNITVNIWRFVQYTFSHCPI